MASPAAWESRCVRWNGFMIMIHPGSICRCAADEAMKAMTPAKVYSEGSTGGAEASVGPEKMAKSIASWGQWPSRMKPGCGYPGKNGNFALESGDDRKTREVRKGATTSGLDSGCVGGLEQMEGEG